MINIIFHNKRRRKSESLGLANKTNGFDASKIQDKILVRFWKPDKPDDKTKHSMCKMVVKSMRKKKSK